jgi:Uncharacterised nucleotidyltransferase
MRTLHCDLLISACRLEPLVAPSPIELSPAQWREVVDRAAMLGVTGHLHAYLSREPTHCGMNDAEWGRLQRLYYVQGARNAELLSTLAEVLTALAERGIAVIVLKGAALVETVYGNLAVRPMHDADLMVRWADAAGAARALEDLGFEADDWFQPRAWYLENLHHLVPYRRGSVTVEVHHQLLPPGVPLSASPDVFWSRASPAVVGGVATRVLAADDQLLHVALHLCYSHYFAGWLSGVRDLAEITRHSGSSLDWDRVVITASGVERGMHAALLLARDLAGASVPPSVIGRFGVKGGVSASEASLIGTIGRRLVVRTGRDDPLVPTWFAKACIEELLERRSWPGRGVRLFGLVLNAWAGQGRSRGYGRWSVLYGVLVHPWLGLVRKLGWRKPATGQTPPT